MRRRTRRRVEKPLADLAYLVLGYVRGHPDGIYGYRLGQRVGATPLGLPAVRLAQLYRMLHELGRRGLVKRRVEVGGARPSRLVFSITAAGAAAFRRWLTGPPRGAVPVRDQLLQRLRFVDALPERALKRLVRDAVRECMAEQEALRAAARVTATGTREMSGAARALMAMALERRVAADRGWLAELERLARPDASDGAAEAPAARTLATVDGRAAAV